MAGFEMWCIGWKWHEDKCIDIFSSGCIMPSIQNISICPTFGETIFKKVPPYSNPTITSVYEWHVKNLSCQASFYFGWRNPRGLANSVTLRHSKTCLELYTKKGKMQFVQKPESGFLKAFLCFFCMDFKGYDKSYSQYVEGDFGI